MEMSRKRRSSVREHLLMENLFLSKNLLNSVDNSGSSRFKNSHVVRRGTGSNRGRARAFIAEDTDIRMSSANNLCGGVEGL